MLGNIILCFVQELDEAAIAALIKDTMVLVTKDYHKWNWGLLFSFLQHPSLKPTHINEDALFSRYVCRAVLQGGYESVSMIACTSYYA